MTSNHTHSNECCVNNNMHEKFFVAKGGRLPTHETMRSIYTKIKELIYFKMTEGEVATVHTMVARTSKASCALNRPFEHIKRSITFEQSYCYYSPRASS